MGIARPIAFAAFQGESAGVKEAHVSVWNVTLERLGARRQEERVVLAPSCQKRRLVLAKIGLEFGIQRDVAFVVPEEVELDFISTGRASSSILKFRIISGSSAELVGPGVNDGMAVEFIHGSHDASLEFLLGCDADVAQH